MNEKAQIRIIVGCGIRADAPAKEVFPLLCPVREYDWIESWRCKLLFSESGAAENNCIFTTDRPGEGKRTWVVSRYEPPKAVEFVIFQGHRLVVRLDLYLSEEGDGSTQIRVTHTITALNEEAAADMKQLEPAAIQRRWQGLEKALNHYLKTGACLEGS